MSYYKDITWGRTSRGSLISKTNDRVHLEIIEPEDMDIVSPMLAQLTRQGIPYTIESKKVHSPRHKAYVRALVIDFQAIENLPFSSLTPTKLKDEVISE